MSGKKDSKASRHVQAATHDYFGGLGFHPDEVVVDNLTELKSDEVLLKEMYEELGIREQKEYRYEPKTEFEKWEYEQALKEVEEYLNGDDKEEK